MSISSTAFHWLEILEKEFDKALIDLNIIIRETEFEDYSVEDEVRKKMSILASAFSQLAQKSQAIFENNAKLEAKNIALKDELLGAMVGINSAAPPPPPCSSSSSSHVHSDQSTNNLRNEINLLKKENNEMKEYIVALQGEVYGARLAAKYLDKELAGRIQQIQLLSRRMDGPEHDRLWNTLEAEIQLHRHKTVMRACQGRQLQQQQQQQQRQSIGQLERNESSTSSDSNTATTASTASTSTLSSDHVNLTTKAEETTTIATNNYLQPQTITTREKYQTSCLRRVQLHRDSHEGLGISVTGGYEHGIPLMISDIHQDTPASRCAQLRIGDAILAVNGCDLREMKHADAVKTLAQEKGDIVLDVVYVYPGNDFEEREENLVLITESGNCFPLYDPRYQPVVQPTTTTTSSHQDQETASQDCNESIAPTVGSTINNVNSTGNSLVVSSASSSSLTSASVHHPVVVALGQTSLPGGVLSTNNQ